MASKMCSDTLSTSFSGVGTPEVASNMLYTALQDLLKKYGSSMIVSKPKVLSQIE